MHHKKEIGFIFRDMSNLIKRDLDRRMGCDEECHNRTGGQGFMIGYIYEHSKDGAVFQRDIEKAFHIRRSSVTGALKLLEKNGYIRREAVKEDARLKKIILTEKAVQRHQRISAIIDEFESDVIKGISQDDLDAFYRVVNQVKNNIGN
ncbi:MAG: MarR family transcriptional regulator [Anaerostipes sp.]|jgi:DNA-binding MarR family transcriptional regulator|nr:MarR family transcriptional regulator [Anaerostipes sp.]